MSNCTLSPSEQFIVRQHNIDPQPQPGDEMGWTGDVRKSTREIYISEETSWTIFQLGTQSGRSFTGDYLLLSALKYIPLLHFRNLLTPSHSLFSFFHSFYSLLVFYSGLRRGKLLSFTIWHIFALQSKYLWSNLSSLHIPI